jgi:hypothetical protein
MSLEWINIPESSLGGIAESWGDGVASNTRDLGLRVGDDFSTLDVEALNLSERIADELRDDSEHLAGVDREALSVESGVSHSVGVEVASVGIASSGITGC